MSGRYSWQGIRRQPVRALLHLEHQHCRTSKGKHLPTQPGSLRAAPEVIDDVLGSLCIGVQFSWRAIGVGLLSMLSVRYWGLGPVKESTG
jgi:hypothetical protein